MSSPKSSQSETLFTPKIILLLVIAAALSAGVTYYIRYTSPQTKSSPHANNPNVIPLRAEPLEQWREKSRLSREQNYLAQQVFPYISKNQKAVKDCYFGYRGRERLPVEKGASVTVQFTIHPDGRVSHIGLFRSEMKIQAIHDCIFKAMATWKFPQHHLGKPAVVQYPFFFR